MRLIWIALALLVLLLPGCALRHPDPWFTFQEIDYRTGGANRAFLGTVGARRGHGADGFYAKYVPNWNGLALTRTPTIGRTRDGRYDFRTTSRLEASRGSVAVKSGGRAASTESYEIFQVMDIRGMVEQLNSPRNCRLLKFLRQSKDFRIVTAMVTVTSVLRETAAEVDTATRYLLQTDPSGVAYVEAMGRDGQGNPRSRVLTISDSMIHAYEYGRIIWDERTGLVADIVVDRPGIRPLCLPRGLTTDPACLPVEVLEAWARMSCPAPHTVWREVSYGERLPPELR